MHSIIHKKENSKGKKKKKEDRIGKTENPDPETTFPFLFPARALFEVFQFDVGVRVPSQDPRHEVPFLILFIILTGV
ncbi:hypothetical protein CEXT_24671 [Caerostris extrusa]|uniref:Uncharacterized protein n=1 Tax=Caerostris extrusa TaxID=172846 RepID=A0AAV4V9K1_CAEEX|nr:hypothetical protein CEXT_24671 [Caerostris extrusa]